LQKSLSELDQELVLEQVGIQDGCGASVALLVGDKLFTAVIGSCGILLFSYSPQPGQDGWSGIGISSSWSDSVSEVCCTHNR